MHGRASFSPTQNETYRTAFKVGSGLTLLNNGQMFGGDFNFMTEP